MEEVALHYVKLTNQQNVDEHTGGNWLIYDTKHHKDN